jgi:hypothetical protein
MLANVRESAPQGLKPRVYAHVCGTVEAVPFQSPVYAPSVRLSLR